jgi:hypothetical protein
VHHSKVGVPRSATDQKQTLRCVQPMSALLPKADIAEQSLDVRFVPEADIRLSPPVT